VLQDLKRQAAAEECDNSQVFFELAACYFNGYLTDADLHLGLNYLSEAVRRGNLDAIGSATNVFEACGCAMPSDIKAIVDETLNELGPSSVHSTVWDLCPLTSPVAVDHASIRNHTWARIHPTQYSSFASGDDLRILNCDSFNVQQRRRSAMFEQPARQGGSDCHQIQSCATTERANLLALPSDAFVIEVRQLGCLNTPDVDGLTLLQTAVSRNDFLKVQLLVEQLQADVNEVGNTTGWTPLWISCLFGYHDIAMFLLKKGASPHCCDIQHGVTILHTLSQFSEAYQVRDIVDMALNAGIDIDTTASNGMTPLHATFVSWDYSRGAAAQILLEHGADPTRQAPYYLDVITPIALCARLLDIKLLESMLMAAERLPGLSTGDAHVNLGMAKAQAFCWLTYPTRFWYMCTVGKGYEAALASALHLILDADMMHELARDQRVNPGTTPLRCACHLSRSHIVKALLEVAPSIDLESVEGDPGQRPCLQLAIQRRSRECAEILINHGAQILYVAPDGQNALHVAAHYFPSLLPQLIASAEAMNSDTRGGTMKEILDLRNKRGYSVFGLLLAEGYLESTITADLIRSKYDLDYDSLAEYQEESSATLTGVLIRLSVSHGLIPVGQIQYLLDLEPQPSFVCSNDGETLLTRAVGGRMSCESQNQLL
jgi:ankyrin repeat protein